MVEVSARVAVGGIVVGVRIRVRVGLYLWLKWWLEMRFMHRICG